MAISSLPSQLFLPSTTTSNFPTKESRGPQEIKTLPLGSFKFSLSSAYRTSSILSSLAMQAGLGSAENISFSTWWPFLIAPSKKFQAKVTRSLQKVKKIGEDDPRRVLHSLKVGLALTLVSIFYYVKPLFDGFGSSVMWAVVTILFSMEYTVGCTLSKGLNHTFATLLATAMGLAAHYIAILSGERGELIVLGVFVFLIASAATFLRFLPAIKARYDYGVIIFFLMFTFVTLSSYRVEDVIQMAYQTLSATAVGVAVGFCTSIFVFPVWAGQDLHRMTAANLEKLASFLEGLEAEYFGEMGGENLESKSFLHCHTSVLNSEPTEGALANFARWEPRHGRLGFRHPWSQYLKIGATLRQCACSMEAVAAFIATTNSSPPIETELRQNIQSACAELSSETSKALKELALAILTFTSPSVSHKHITTAMAASEKLRATLTGSGTVVDFLDVAIIASLLVEMVWQVGNVAAAVDELALLAGFKIAEAPQEATGKPVAEGESPPHVVIDVKN